MGIGGNKMNNKSYKYKRGGTKQSFFLKEEDMYVLTILYYKRYLTTRQITMLYSAIRGVSCIEGDIFKKLKRYCQYGGLLTRKIDRIEGSITKRAVFSLKESAIQFLQEKRRIPQNASTREVHIDKLSNHTMCSREISTQTLLQISQKTPEQLLLRDIDVRSFYIQNNVSIKEHKFDFIPDEFISYKEKTVYIEMDMLTETHGILIEKTGKYIEYAKQSNEDIALVFVLFDQSMYGSKDVKPPYGRMKNLLFALRAYHEQLMSIDNLRVYVCSLHEAGDVISDFLLGADDYYGKEYFEQNILLPLSQRAVGDADWRYAFVEKVQTFKELIDGGLRRAYRRDKDVIQDFFFIFGHENEYRSIARLDDVVFSRKEGDTAIPLVVIYPRREKNRDILLMDTYSNVLLFSTGNENVNIDTDENIMVRSASSQYPSKRRVIELY